VGLNLEKTQALLGSLATDDPDSLARQQLIPVSARESQIRLRAISLMTADLLREPTALLPVGAPVWLSDLTRSEQTGREVLFDGRLTELATRVVDDVVSQGCPTHELVAWLEGRALS
jgi:hypothetical protein